ncbi:RNA pyrophosphohydrolase [Oleiphilus sp. HI0009]|uniref:RNA pyrophosphohydrolase n=2 Tax=Oleiphilus TaxID=141450 RepID=UPI0007C2DE68|nr:MULTISPECIES: RNA pyrophosphohydrolase [unclassified Oleiphilus]KZX72064.1 RNA pyrophosphohydrolase [Oleiphilus sp. HI0009]MCH2158854.1 RNA pyrophosphohydrolase [Oleiphilaceae bacterium]KZX84240.1 RNA pyrophosphohydrolase [Oleiphilus sp. HI0009]KZY61968.1 RNA pyrophosphohydrolase [Oleiphilus sp. HI0066]KZY67928.1 RNA pyrophosphohydrolase [Oleiphilus sp. HI0066]
MIDSDGFRSNVGIILANQQNEVLWARRIGQTSWQFPQGGIKPHETPEQALYRELYEEIGLVQKDVQIVAQTEGWLRYRLPKRLVRHNSHPVCIGQKQKWFLLRMIGQDESISLSNGETPEFDGWDWVSYWYPLGQVVSFKREVYRRALKDLSSHLFTVD